MHASEAPSRGVDNERIAAVLRLTRGPRVLHPGCCNNVFPRTEEELSVWLHFRLVDAGYSVLGADINRSYMDHMEDAGYEVEYMDAQDIPSEGEKFDTIVAGEIIEHLENPGSFLAGCRRRLKPDGRLVLTTPNPFAPMHVLAYVRAFDSAFNKEHICWFDAQTLSQLLERCGYRVREMSFVDDLHPKAVKRKYSRLDYYLYRAFVAGWTSVRRLMPSRFGNTIVVFAEAEEGQVNG